MYQSSREILCWLDMTRKKAGPQKALEVLLETCTEAGRLVWSTVVVVDQSRGPSCSPWWLTVSLAGPEAEVCWHHGSHSFGILV